VNLQKKRILEVIRIVAYYQDTSNLLPLPRNHIEFSTSKYIIKQETRIKSCFSLGPKIVFDRDRDRDRDRKTLVPPISTIEPYNQEINFYMFIIILKCYLIVFSSYHMNKKVIFYSIGHYLDKINLYF
jgi:hypothetical protein